MAEIPLTQGRVAIVDDADLPLVTDRPWQVLLTRGNAYASGDEPHSRKREYMHRVILGLGPDDPHVDHVNGDGLDNRRANLRLATQRQNMGNMRPRGGVSRFKGVVRHRQRWMANIRDHGRRRYLGTFIDETAAARAYDQAAREIFGPFARLNFEGDD